jgi:hypothetical protein
VLSLDWDRRGAGNARLNPRPRKHGLELSQGVKALARAAAERRKASAPRKQMSCADCVHLSAARAARKALIGGNADRAARHWLDAPLGAPLPLLLQGANLFLCVVLGRARA